MSFYEADYIPANAMPKPGEKPSKKDQSNFSFDSFTGNLILQNLDGTTTAHQISYSNAQVVHVTSSAKNSSGRQRVADIQVCTFDGYVDCEWAQIYTSCVEYGVTYDSACNLSQGLAGVADDGCTYTLNLLAQTPVTTCQTIYIPDLPPSPPLIPTSELTSPTDPCNQKATVNKNAADPTIAGQNAAILAQGKATGYEYGTNQNLTSLTGNTYVNTPVATDPVPSKDSYAGIDPTWNSSGYTLGESHYHPGGEAPSPQDVFAMLNIFGNADFQKGGNTALQFYQKNASITVVTQNATFVVTVNDFNSLQLVKQAYEMDPVSFMTSYNKYAHDYLEDAPADLLNSPSFTLTASDASEYALKRAFGNIINLYKAPANSTTFTPRIIGSSGSTSIIANLHCPN